MGALEFITGQVNFKLHYNQIYQLKTTMYCLRRAYGSKLMAKAKLLIRKIN